MNPAAEGLVNNSNTIRCEEENSSVIFKYAKKDCDFSVNRLPSLIKNVAFVGNTNLQRAHCVRSPTLFVKIGIHRPHQEAGYIPIGWQD